MPNGATAFLLAAMSPGFRSTDIDIGADRRFCDWRVRHVLAEPPKLVVIVTGMFRGCLGSIVECWISADSPERQVVPRIWPRTLVCYRRRAIREGHAYLSWQFEFQWPVSYILSFCTTTCLCIQLSLS